MKVLGNKVILRPMEEFDKEMLLHLIQDPEMIKITGGYPQPASYDHQIRWFCSEADFSGDLHRIIADKEKPGVGLGILLLSHVNLEKETGEIFIKLTKASRRKGYGQDAVRALVDYAFQELGIRQITANILEDNEVSRRLFEKCGFRQEGMERSKVFREGQYKKVCIYRKRKNEDFLQDNISVKR